MFEIYFKKQSEHWHNISLEKFRLSAFKHFKEINVEYDCLLIAIEYYFSLSSSNASV